ncbi:PLC-like phosphodiesterase, partial [Piromyces finnis]
ANWMTYINDNIPINKINILGTHDTGTYDIGILGGLLQTQSLDITEQLEHGIRYFDIRLALKNEKDTKLYLSHAMIPCKELPYLYFSDVLEESVKFLQHHCNETIIMHLNNEDIPKVNEVEMDISDIIYDHIKKFPSRYFYTGTTIPKLGDVRSRIVIITR